MTAPNPLAYLALDEGNERARLRHAYLLAACNEGRRAKGLEPATTIEPETIKKTDELAADHSPTARAARKLLG